MYLRLICNDMRKSKLITLTTLLFVMSSALLMSLAAILMVHLAGSIDTLMIQAKTPHFLQMHQGEINHQRMDAFALNNEEVEDYQILEFLNIEGSKIQLGSKTLADSVQDNGFSIQSERFDYLLDLDGQIIRPNEGELYVPITYMKEGITQVGDQAMIAGVSFKVAGFLRDAQMNSPLSSSKRFLIHETDYAKIRGLGQLEYLIEFRLKDTNNIGKFEVAYTDAGLEANGPAITHVLFKVINALSDGLMIAVIVLVSGLVVAVALMCIRFTLLAKIEEDYQEIGVMKAIGIQVKDIKKIYLAKYGVITAVGCLLGVILSTIFKSALLENIRLYFGESGNELWADMIGILGALVIFIVVMLYVNSVVRRFKKLSAADAIRFGGDDKEKQGSLRFFSLASRRFISTNTFLGIKDVLVRKKLYLTMLIVLAISILILAVPRRLQQTIASENFTTYMGVGICDIRMDIQQVQNPEEKISLITSTLEQDKDIKKYSVLTTKMFDVVLKDGTKERIKVELGDHQSFPVYYIEGSIPVLENEIALSMINASELEKKVGDTLTLIVEGKASAFNICGIYSDITNGGKSAKANFVSPTASTMRSDICISIVDESVVNEKALELRETFKFAKVATIKQYVASILGGTIRAIDKAASIAMFIALLLSFFITLLFIRMLMAKDRVNIAILKAIGFNSEDLTKQYLARSGCILMIALVVGLILVSTLGESVAGVLLANLGAAGFEFTTWPIRNYILYSALMIGTVISATLIGTSYMKNIIISENIKE